MTFRNPVANQLFGTPLNVPLHPTQIYEAAAEALTFGILYARFHRPHKAGGVIGLYLSLYAVARFVIEFFRAPESPNPFGGPFTTAQWISIGLFVLGAVVLTRRPKAAGR